MSASLTWPVVLSLFAGVATVGLFAYLLTYREKPGASWFAATMVAQAVFLFAYGIGLTVFEEQLRLAFEVVALVGLSWLGPPFVGFGLEYTGRGDIRRSWYYWLLYLVPVLTLVLLPINHIHGLFWTEFAVDPVFGVAAASYDFGPLFYVMLIGGPGWAVVGVLLLADTVWDYGSLFRSEALAVIASAIFPAVGLLVWMLELTPNSHFIWAAPLFAGHVLCDYYAFVGKDMFEIYPATNRAAKQSALADFRAPVLVLEAQHRIVDLNPAAEEELELDREEVVLEPASAVIQSLDPGRDSPESFDQYVDGDEEWRISPQVGAQRREYVIQPSPLTAGGRERVGYTLLFQDITDEVRREERLSVLNRILRHNLRNDLSIVSGYVSAADSHTDDEMVREMLQKVSTTVDELIETGEMAREFEQLLAAPDGYSRAITVGDLTEKLASRLAEEHPEADLSVTTTETVVETNPDVLRAVLWQLLENAAIHTDGPAEISLSVTGSPESIDIEVSDNGSGIPDHELQSLESGEETSLKHGSGFGLWLAKWGTVRVGGAIDFETSDGTTVTVTIPREEQSAQTSSASA
ncbi:sensor histidine kinase [Halovenus salina]|uniref:sensor histidine kinase n=1 Tax=Halovenus salina TaxID=1510225 RepID=UPI002260D78E|nr:histidine kinase N-terminal 7TM domain-containing protein [Halovenus salina]